MMPVIPIPEPGGGDEDALASHPAQPWQPLTAGGVARFGDASWRRMAFFTVLTAAVTVGVFVWLLLRIYLPAVEKAFAAFPEEGILMEGRLQWHGPPQKVLFRDSFLEIAAHFDAHAPAGQTADVRIEIRPKSLRAYSLFGYLEVPYQPEWVVAANRLGLQAWLGAWRLPLLAMFSMVVFISLVVIWLVLATLYCFPVYLLGQWSDRELTLIGSWKLAMASLFPGAFLMVGALGLYGTHYLNLMGLLVALPLHIVAAWLYIILAVRRRPHEEFTPPQTSGRNPFHGPTLSPPRKAENPFGE